MASPHVLEIIQTSDQEEQNENEQIQPFGNLCQLSMDSDDLLYNNDKVDPQTQLFEVVNECNKTLHVFSPQNIIPVNQDDQANVAQNPHPPVNVLPLDKSSPGMDENYDYETPPVPDEMFTDSESESNDTPDYILDSSAEEEEEEIVPQIRIPIKNYPNDAEHDDDCPNGWLWPEEDTGASYGPFIGNPGLNIPPSQKDPCSYFELFFDPLMYTKISSKTNNYAGQRIQNVTGHLLDFYSISTGLLLNRSFP